MIHRDQQTTGVGVGDRLAASALRASVASSALGAVSLIGVGLLLSWTLTYVAGGAGTVVPHWYYVPILFAAVRFGLLAALVVALVSTVLAGPLTLMDVDAGTAQGVGRWLTRGAFFAVIGSVMAALVRPSLPSITEEVRLRREERALRQGLERGEFWLRYQPIVDCATQQVHGVEALLRWQHPTRGELAPDAFLAAAERTDVIHDLGAFVLAEACEQAAAWHRTAQASGRRPIDVAVNMSARELESPELVERVRRCLARSGLAPETLCVEVTESVVAADLDATVARLWELKELGIRLAVDDFGTGYSSLSSVHRFPIDVLKLDRSFVAPIGTRPDVESMLGGLVLFARSVRLTTVAEGVETEAQARAIAELGYDLAQGYHYARPSTVREIDRLLDGQPAWLDVGSTDGARGGPALP